MLIVVDVSAVAGDADVDADAVRSYSLLIALCPLLFAEESIFIPVYFAFYIFVCVLFEFCSFYCVASN